MTSTLSMNMCPNCGQTLRYYYQYCIRCGQLYLPSDVENTDRTIRLSALGRILQPVPVDPRPVDPADTAGEKDESNLFGGWMFSVVAGGYSVATVAVANVILWVISFCMSAAYEWVGGGVWFIIFAFLILAALVSLGSPVLIALGVIGAIVGAIAGGLVGAGMGLVCVLGYWLGSFYKPLRPFILYPISVGLAVYSYTKLFLLRDFLQDLPFSVWIDILNFVLFGLTGLVIAWSFLTKPVELSSEESEESWQAAMNVFGAPWRFYRRAGRWANTAYEEEQKNYTVHRALGAEKNTKELLHDLERAYKKSPIQGRSGDIRRLEGRFMEQQEKEERFGATAEWRKKR